MTPNRLRKIAGLRQEIAAGTYDTPEKMKDRATKILANRDSFLHMTPDEARHVTVYLLSLCSSASKPTLVRGGQGRDCREVIGYAWILLVCVLIGGLLFVGLLIAHGG